jgi:NTP pyrophosphatase (non-canonical NTP hydrolase)
MEIVEAVVKNNTLQFTMSKTAEECSELATVLLQGINKRHDFPKKQIIEEIGDVEWRIKILKKHLGIEKEVEDRINYKKEKLKSYLEKGKYKGGM